MNIKIAKANANAIIPENFYSGDAGVDLCASEKGSIKSGETKIITYKIPAPIHLNLAISVILSSISLILLDI